MMHHVYALMLPILLVNFLFLHLKINYKPLLPILRYV